MPQRNNAIHYLLLITAIAFWGLSFVFTKELLNNILPIQLIFCRMVIAATLLSLICVIHFRQRLRDIPLKDWLNLLALSFFEPFLYFLFETYSLSYADPTVVSVIVSTIPLFTVFLSLFYFKERLTFLNISGVFVSVIGIVIMLLPEWSNADFQWRGILLAFGAVMASVGYSFFIRKLADKYNPVFIVSFQNTVGIVLFLPLFLYELTGEGAAVTFLSALASPDVMFNVLMLAVLCSSLAFVFYVIALRRMGLARANTFTNLIPVVTAIAAFFIVHEHFSFHKIIGTIVVIAGVFFVQKKPTGQLLNENRDGTKK